MKRVVCLLVMCWIPLIAAESAIEAVGLRIVGQGLGADQQDLRPFNWNSGTTIALRLHYPTGGILGIDKEKSALDILIDDKGTDLTKAKPGANTWNNNGIGAFPTISKDGRYILLELNGSGLPIASATSIKAQGHIQLTCASKYESETLHNIDLKEGAVIKTKKATYTISKIGKPDWGDAELQVTLKTSDDTEVIKSIIFKKAGGPAIDVQQGFTSRMGWNGNYTTEIAYNFPKKIDKVDIFIETWMDKKNIKIPFDLQVGVGIK